MDLIIRKDAQRNFSLLSCLTKLLDIAVDFCDVEGVADAHLLHFVDASCKVLFHSRYNSTPSTPQSTDEVCTFACDSLRRVAGFALCNILYSSQNGWKALLKRCERKIPSILDALRNAPEVSVQTSIVRVLLHLDRSGRIPHNRSIRGEIQNAIESVGRKQTKSLFAVFSSIESEEDYDRVHAFIEELGSVWNDLGIQRRIASFGDCAVKLMTLRGVSIVSGAFQDAHVHWNMRCLAIGLHDSDESVDDSLIHVPFRNIISGEYVHGGDDIHLKVKNVGYESMVFRLIQPKAKSTWIALAKPVLERRGIWKDPVPRKVSRGVFFRNEPQHVEKERIQGNTIQRRIDSPNLERSLFRTLRADRILIKYRFPDVAIKTPKTMKESTCLGTIEALAEQQIIVQQNAAKASENIHCTETKTMKKGPTRQQAPRPNYDDSFVANFSQGRDAAARRFEETAHNMPNLSGSHMRRSSSFAPNLLNDMDSSPRVLNGDENSFVRPPIQRKTWCKVRGTTDNEQESSPIRDLLTGAHEQKMETSLPKMHHQSTPKSLQLYQREDVLTTPAGTMLKHNNMTSSPVRSHVSGEDTNESYENGSIELRQGKVKGIAIDETYNLPSVNGMLLQRISRSSNSDEEAHTKRVSSRTLLRAKRGRKENILTLTGDVSSEEHGKMIPDCQYSVGIFPYASKEKIGAMSIRGGESDQFGKIALSLRSAIRSAKDEYEKLDTEMRSALLRMCTNSLAVCVVIHMCNTIILCNLRCVSITNGATGWSLLCADTEKEECRVFENRFQKYSAFTVHFCSSNIILCCKYTDKKNPNVQYRFSGCRAIVSDFVSRNAATKGLTSLATKEVQSDRKKATLLSKERERNCKQYLVRHASTPSKGET